MNGQAGKGDKPRPTDLKKYGDNYDRIFRRPQKLSKHDFKSGAGKR